MPRSTLARTTDRFESTRVYALTAALMATFYAAMLGAAHLIITLGWYAT
ncbi:hypothetical protein [Rhodococcus sp. NPDC004095]